MHIFHKWKYYDGCELDTLEGETVERYYNEYRMCRICKKVQEFNYDSQGGGWSTLDKQRTDIFMRNVLPNRISRRIRKKGMEVTG